MNRDPRSRNLRRYGPMLVVGALLLTACGDDVDSDPQATSDVVVTHEFTTDQNGRGVRATLVEADGSYSTKIIEMCDARDYVSVNLTGGGLSRNEDHPACVDDNQLTPADFQTTG